MARFTVPVAVVVLLERACNGKRQVLLQRRQNTGFGDGLWDFSCSGHVECGEGLRDACIRECGEELGIDVKAENLRFFTLVYKRDGDITYCNPYFILAEFSGVPRICEEGKCSAIGWFDIDALPSALLPDRREALLALQNGTPLIEYTVK